MRNFPVAHFRRTLTSLFFAIAFVCTFVTYAQAQSMTEQRRARVMVEQDLADREWELRNLGKLKRVDAEVVPPQVRLSKVKEDYEGLQTANNNILTMLSAGQQINYRVVADSASDIKKRAGRLRSYLLTLQIIKDNDKRKRNPDEIEMEEMRASLLSLDASIISLIKSPVFKDFGKVVDAGSSTKTRDDLDSIIELSERIKRSVERNLKAARASR